MNPWRPEHLAGQRRQPGCQFYGAGLLNQIILGVTPVILTAGAHLLPRRIASDHLSFRTAELIGQRIRIVLDIRG